MRDKEILGLYEAYMEVVENQQLDEGLKSIDTPEKAQGYAIRALGSATKAAFTGDKKTYEKRKKGLKMGQRKAERKAVEEQREQVDLFDYILEHLVAEGYADTNESALAIMANMSEEWRESIVEELEQLDEISQKTATRAYAQSRSGEFEGADSNRDIKRTDNLEKHIKRKFGDKAVQDADRHADSTTFGRKDPRTGKRQPSPKPRIEKNRTYRTTKAGKMHGQDQAKLKSDLKYKRSSEG